MFDYVSTIISYLLVGVAIFSGMYDSYSPAQLASAISKVRESEDQNVGVVKIIFPPM